MFIRTKEGHILKYEDVKNRICANNILKPTTQYVETSFKHWEEIVEKVDFIKDLCDEFIGIFKDDGPEPNFREYHLEELLSEIPKYTDNIDDVDIYGAIWTDKGLIYVTKIDKGGKFELL